MNLSLNLKAVISQRLVIGKDGKRLPAVEVLINTPLIRDMIRRGQVHEIKEAMDKSLQEGMQTFDQALFRCTRKARSSWKKRCAKPTRATASRSRSASPKAPAANTTRMRMRLARSRRAAAALAKDAVR
jgi:Tfp pilus assembly ATPase PilU